MTRRVLIGLLLVVFSCSHMCSADILEWTLNSPTPTDNEYFGTNVSIDGSFVIVASFSNHVDIYEAPTYNHVFHYTISLYTFGGAVAISGNFAVAGVPRNNYYVGTVYTFEYNGTAWSTLTQTLHGSNYGEQYGSSLALANSGQYLVVGTYAANQGKVYAYGRQNSAWNQLDMWTQTYEYYGSVVAATYSSGVLTIAALAETSVEIYKLVDGTFSEQSLTKASGYSSSMDIQGNSLVLGGSSKNANSGVIRMYSRINESSNFTISSTISAPENGYAFGSSVAFSSNSSVVVGAPLGGRAYCYNSLSGSWSNVSSYSPSNGVTGADWGISVATNSDNSVIVLGSMTEGGGQKGQVRVFVVVDTPSSNPSSQPTKLPSDQPTSQPSFLPTGQPSGQPSTQPSSQPTGQPSSQPSSLPSVQPTDQPSIQPTGQPTGQPSCQPSSQPSIEPSGQPSDQPTDQPTSQPSGRPSSQPTSHPSSQPSAQPSGQPSDQPSSQPTGQPSDQPSEQPSNQPSCQPSCQPSAQPSGQPSDQPSVQPSCQPSGQPSEQPTSQPSNQPSGQPSGQPSSKPSAQPSTQPSCQPTDQPSDQPSGQPSIQPSNQPTRQPSGQPSAQPSCQPTGQPSSQPTGQPSDQPSDQPSEQPSGQPSVQPSCQPTGQPSSQPSSHPSSQPSGQPSGQPTVQPSGQPSAQPTVQPSCQPSAQPSLQPSSQPSDQPSAQPSGQPSEQPSVQPSGQPSGQPTIQPSSQPSAQPSSQPSCQPSDQPSAQPSGQPSDQPSVQPSCQPSGQPSEQPTSQPSNQPSGQPSGQPSSKPSAQPSTQPSCQPTDQPSDQPSGQPSIQPSNQPTRQPSGQPSAQPSCQPTGQPSSQPTGQPSDQPSDQPSAQPSGQPSVQPSCQPTGQPSSQPTVQPSVQPSDQPSGQPSDQPTAQPSGQPNSQPSQQPSDQPSVQPSAQPSDQPSAQPSDQPTAQPSGQPTAQPTAQPSEQPSGQPTKQPTAQPSGQPSAQPSDQPSAQPSDQPTAQPSGQPTKQPTAQPSGQPSCQPSQQPSDQPSVQPSSQPSQQPSDQPSDQPTAQPSGQPTGQPSAQPSGQPSAQPSDQPSAQPSDQPTAQPSGQPTKQPTAQPSGQPSCQPSQQPSDQPSVQPSAQPSGQPSDQPSDQPTAQPSGQPTKQPTAQPSGQPSAQPSDQPSAQPSDQPTAQPSGQPSCQPSQQPSDQPSVQPSAQPSGQPSAQPSDQPTVQPSGQPTKQPTAQPSGQPSSQPSQQPSDQPSVQPSAQPSGQPSDQPSDQPTAQPSGQPTKQPTGQPSAQPSGEPSGQPTVQPSGQPSAQPSGQPSAQPSDQPTAQPSGQPTNQPSGEPSGEPSSNPSPLPSTRPSRHPTVSPTFHPTSSPTVSPSVVPTTHPSPLPTLAPVPTITFYPTESPTLSVSPTCFPTVAPTTSPTAAPSFSPTISALTFWEEEVSLYNSGLSTRFAKQSVFLDLVVNDARAYGGCDLWKAFVGDDVSASLIVYSPLSISMVARTTLESTFGEATVTCNASVFPNLIVSKFSELALMSAQGFIPETDVISSFECGGHTWRVGQCANIAVPYVCVDCFIDTCRASSSSLFESQLVPFTFWYQDSCLSANAVESSHPAWFRSLVIEFDHLAVAPDITSVVASSPLSGEIVVNLTLSEPEGTVVCAAYESSAVFVPTEVKTLLLQNQAIEVRTEHVSFSITGLLSSVEYDIYCATFSVLDAVMSVEDMLQTKITHTTSCCRVIEVEVLQNSVSNNEDVPSTVKITLPAILPDDLTLTFATEYYVNASMVALASSGEKENPFAPAAFSFSNSSISFVKYIAYVSSRGMKAGLYQLDFELSGLSAYAYSVSYVAGEYLSVLNAENEPSSPNIRSATFSADGSHFVVLFDSSTNRGNGNNNFYCSALLSFTSITSLTKCQWIDDKRIEVYSNGNSGAVVGDRVSLLPNSLKAKCRVLGNGGPACSAWAHSDISDTTISPPLSPALPAISLIAPSQIGPCDALPLDLTSSSGAGGRRFASWRFSVTSRHPNSSAIDDYLAQVDSIQRPLSVPSALFSSGYAYSVSATLCTFLGGCGRASHTVVVSSSGNVPIVSVNSEKIRNVNRYSLLKIRGDGYTSQCDGTTSTTNLVFTWELQVYDGQEEGFVTVTDPSLQSIAVDPRYFMLPAYSLPVATLYSLSLTVQHMESLKYSSTSISITAVQGNVVAVILGPSEVGLQIDRALIVDAGDSFDEDNNVAFGSAAGLTFSFSCKQLYPSYDERCLLDLTSLSTSSVSVSVPQSDATMIGSVHEVSVVVQHSADGRNAETFLTINILPSLAPVVEVQAENTRLNPSQKLKLLGVVEFVSSGLARWNVDDASIDLDVEASSVTSRDLISAGDGSVQSLTMSLVIPPHILPEKSTFNFGLSVQLDSGYSNTATVTVVTNSPPLPGSFVMSPRNGTMLVTFFTFSAENWEDSDRPISYSFGFLQDESSFSVLRSKSEVSYFTSRDLPSGSALDGYILRTHLEVYDVMNAKSSVSTPIQVAEGEEMNATAIDSYITSSMSSSGAYSDDIKVAVAVTNVIINSVNCSAVATLCSSLNRQNCSRTANTCGGCLGGYVGEDFDSNSKCIADSIGNGRRLLQASSRVGQSCLSDDDCVSENWEVCHKDTHACIIRPKECPSDCGSNGTCVYRSVINASVAFEDCNVLQFDCQSYCECDFGHMGTSCEFWEEDFTALQKTRHKLVEAIQSISLTEDPTQDAVISWLQSLAGVCNDSSGLLTETLSLIASLTVDFLQLASTFKLSFEEISSVTKTVDLLISAMSIEDTLNSTDTEDVNAAGILQAYSDFIAHDMVEGQTAITILTQSYRFGVHAISGNSATSSVLYPPQSKLEEALSQPTQEAILPASSSSGVMKVTVTEVPSMLHSQTVNVSSTGPLLSVPLGLQMSKYSCVKTGNEEFCSVVVVLQNALQSTFPLLSGTVLDVPEASYECKNRRPGNITHECEGGFNITQSCNGTKGNLVFQCPSPLYSAACLSIGINASTCELVEFSSSNVTCKCTLPIVPESSVVGNQRETVTYSQRKKMFEEEEEQGDTSVSVDFSSAASSTWEEFSSTFSSAGSLDYDKVLGSWEVLLTLGFILLFGVIFIAYGYSVDKKEEKEKDIKVHLQKVVHAKGLTKKRRNFPHHSVVPADIPVSSALRKKQALSLKERSNALKAMRRQSGRAKRLGEDEHKSLDLALPSVLQPLPLWTRYKTELKVYHRWAGVYYHYSTVYSRPLRALSLVTNIVVMLFIEAVTYDLADPDDGSCELHETEVACLSEESSLASESKCYWDDDEYLCHFKDIKNDMMRVVIVAIFAACLGTPFAILLQVLIQKFLTGEIDEEQQSSLTRFTSRGNAMMVGLRERNLVAVSDNLERGDVTLTRGRSMLRKSLSVKANDVVAEEKLKTTLQEDLSLLFSDLRLFRRTLSDVDRAKFDDVWGLSFMLNDEGISTTRNYFNKIKSCYNTVILKRKRPELVLLDELEHVRESISNEVVMFESSQLSDAQKSKRLLYLFVRDLLDGANGQILDSKNRRDNTIRKRVTMETKVLVCALVTATLLGMLFYVYLFALRQTQERQQAWFQSFVVWIVFEVCLVSTGTVFLMHVVVPTFIVSDVKRVKRNIVKDIVSFKNSLAGRERAFTSSSHSESCGSVEDTKSHTTLDEKEQCSEFNAAKYLFASCRLARMYPELKQSDVVARFSTQWPRRSLKSDQKSVTKSYNNKFTFIMQAFSRVLLFVISSLVQFPEPVQDIFVQLVSTSGFGYIIVLLIQLWRISPLLVAIPLVFLGLVIHFITASSKSSSLLPLSKVQPEVAEKKVVTHDSERFDNSSSMDEVIDFDGERLDSKLTDVVVGCKGERPPEQVNVSDSGFDIEKNGPQELNQLQYILWGKDYVEDEGNDSSESDSDEDYETFFANRKEEMEIYMSRSEAWQQKQHTSGATQRSNLESSDNASTVQKLSPLTSSPNNHKLPPIESSPSAGSPVAGAVRVNSRAGALKTVRRKSKLGSPSVSEVDEPVKENGNCDEEKVMERILRRPRQRSSGSFSLFDDECDNSQESRFKKRSDEVQSRLFDELKASPASAFQSDVALLNINDSSSDSCNGNDDDDVCVNVITKPGMSPRSAMVITDVDSDHSLNREKSTLPVIKPVQLKDLKSVAFDKKRTCYDLSDDSSDYSI